MKISKYLIIFLIYSVSIKCYGTKIIIKYIIKKDTSFHTKANVSDNLLSISNNAWDPIDLNSKKELPATKRIIMSSPAQEIVVFEYKINRNGSFCINDLFGHEIFLDQSMQGDTIVLHLTPNNHLKKNAAGKLKRYLNDSVRSTTYFNITYPPKYKYMGVFDSLAYLHGNLMGQIDYSYKLLNYDLAKYLIQINKVYADRLNLYHDFVSHHNVPAQLKYYAFKEIQYCYYNDLLEPISQVNARLFADYPAALQDTIKSIGNDLNNKALFDNTWYYRTVVFSYTYVNPGNSPSSSLKEQADSSYIVNRLNFSGRYLKNSSRGYVLAWLMELAGKRNLKATFSIVLHTYDYKTSPDGVNRFVDSLNNIIMGLNTLTRQELLSIKITDKAHQKRNLGDVLTKDFVLIDCWATWCVPCRAQMPILDSLALTYKDRVQFISLSADQFMSKWDTWMLKNPRADLTVNQFYAQNGFDSFFFKKLLISEIPRYILIERSGRILNAQMPFPSDAVIFKNELDKYLGAIKQLNNDF